MKKTFAAALLATASLVAPAMAAEQLPFPSMGTKADDCVISEITKILDGVQSGFKSETTNGVTLDFNAMTMVYKGKARTNLIKTCEDETNTKSELYNKGTVDLAIGSARIELR